MCLSFPGDTSGKELVCQCRRHEERWVRSMDQEGPLEEGIATLTSILAWRIPMDRGAWWDALYRIAKSLIMTEATQDVRTTMYLLTAQSISRCSKLVIDTGTIVMQIKNLGFHRREICVECSPSPFPGSYATISHAALNFRKPVLRQHGWTPLSSCSLLCQLDAVDDLRWSKESSVCFLPQSSL